VYWRVPRFEGALTEKARRSRNCQKLVTFLAHVMFGEDVVGVIGHFLAASWAGGKNSLHSFASIGYSRFGRDGHFGQFPFVRRILGDETGTFELGCSPRQIQGMHPRAEETRLFGIQPQSPYPCNDTDNMLPNRDRGRFVGRLPSQGLPWVAMWIDERSGLAS
jgi:hypothetical protein